MSKLDDLFKLRQQIIDDLEYATQNGDEAEALYFSDRLDEVDDNILESMNEGWEGLDNEL